MSRIVLIVAAMWATSVALAVERASIPTADLGGASDDRLLKRYEGSYIVAFERREFADFVLPLSPLEETERRDQNNVRTPEAKTKKELEGAYTRLVYVAPASRSPLEVLRNYQEEIQGKGGKTLYECKVAECGGKPQGGSQGWAGHPSLPRFLYPEDRVTYPFGSNGWCAMMSNVSDLRYAASELPGAHVSVLTYTLDAGTNEYCKALNGRTIAIVDIVEDKPREQRMVVVQAAEMAKQIDSTGSVALYGIYFDFNKADVKPESDPTLEQIAKLRKDSAGLKLLVVGHTDNVGSLAFNRDLSERRAAAVVAALTSRHRIDAGRLTPVGVAFASPIASNKTDEGRAKNRRVELVEQ